MPDWKVPLADVRVTDDDLAAVVATLRSGWLSMGPRTEELEQALAAYCGARHAVAVSSGTAALHLMLAACGIGAGDEVVMPSLTFVASANAVGYTGARPVFADIAGLARPWLAVDAAAAAIGPRTRAILAMPYGGRAGELAGLRELAQRHGLLLLEDAAHGLGGRLDGGHLGTWGSAGTYSFFANKNLAVGEGGAVVTDDGELAARMRTLRSHGMTTGTWDRHHGRAWDYDVVVQGFNYRIDEPRAALARARLRRLDDETAGRASVVDRYRAALDGATALVAPAPGEEPAHHLHAVVLDAGVDRDAVRRRLAERGVQSSVHYPPVHRFSIYADGAPELPVTEAYARRTVTLPLFSGMSDAQVDLVIDAVREALA